MVGPTKRAFNLADSIVWLPGDTYGIVARFDIGAEDEDTALALPPSPAELIVTWRR
jgi:hypothetical protein